MKTMTKKCGLCALAAMVLTAVLLVMGCPATGPEGAGYQPPSGMGTVQVNFNSAIQRATILPNEGSFNIGSFTVFELQFTPNGSPAGGQAKTEYHTAVPTTTTGTVELAVGGYDLVVIGYLAGTTAATKAQPAAAAAVTGSIVVNDGVQTNINVTLQAIINPPAGVTGTGTFSWNIDVSDLGANTINTATMTLTPIGVGTASGPYDLTDGTAPDDWVASDSVAPGYYYVDIDMDVDGVAISFRHVLHVYMNRTSAFSYVFEQEHFGLVIVTGTVGFTSFTYTPIADVELLLTADIGSGPAALTEGYVITLDSSSSESVDLEVTNAAAYGTSITWYSGDTTALGTGATFTVDTATAAITAPFTTTGVRHQVTVVGITTGGVPYYKYFYITVE